MKILCKGRVWSEVKVTFDLENSKVKVMAKVKPLVTFEAWSAIDMLAFRFVTIKPFSAEIYQIPYLTLKI